jgi:hypothetical protein
MTQPIYTKYTTNEGREYVLRVTENETSSIPMDESNSDYQAYLRWLENPEAEQSTPILPA